MPTASVACKTLFGSGNGVSQISPDLFVQIIRTFRT